MIEEWKQIPGYEGIYEASSNGRIRTCYGKTTVRTDGTVRVWKQRILKPKCAHVSSARTDRRVTLYKNGIGKDYLVARLVAAAFYGKRDDMTVNHKDGNYLNNSIDNLEYCTLKDNIRHGYKTGLYDSVLKKTTLIRLCDGEIFEYPSLSAASRSLGRSVGYVSACIINRKNPRDVNGRFYTILGAVE